MSRNLVLLAVVVVCILVVVGDWSYKAATDIDAFVQYMGTLIATFVGVGLAAYLSVRQFYTQARENEDARRQQLSQALGAELLRVLDIFGGAPNHSVLDPTGGNNHITVHFAQLEPIATEEAIRVGLLDPQSSFNLSQLSSLMRDYSTASAAISGPLSELMYGPMTDPRHWVRAYELAKELSRIKMNLIIWCVTVIYGLAAQGVEMPAKPMYRSDPNIALGGRSRSHPS